MKVRERLQETSTKRKKGFSCLNFTSGLSHFGHISFYILQMKDVGTDKIRRLNMKMKKFLMTSHNGTAIGPEVFEIYNSHSISFPRRAIYIRSQAHRQG